MKKIDILVVEDNPNDVFLVKAALDEHGIPHSLHVVADGKAAIEYVTTIGSENGAPCPDLLLLDINLPKASGLEVLSYFRGHPSCLATPVIVFSSSVQPKEQQQLTELKVNRFFRKAIDLDEFFKIGNVVREVVERNESSAA